MYAIYPLLSCIYILLLLLLLYSYLYLIMSCMYVRMCMFYYPKLLLSPISVMHYGKLTNL